MGLYSSDSIWWGRKNIPWQGFQWNRLQPVRFGHSCRRPQAEACSTGRLLEVRPGSLRVHRVGGTFRFAVAEVMAILDHVGQFPGAPSISQDGSLSLILRKTSREKMCRTLSSKLSSCLIRPRSTRWRYRLCKVPGHLNIFHGAELARRRVLQRINVNPQVLGE